MPLRVLIVDDDASTLKLVGLCLTRVGGMEVTACSSGEEAVSALEGHDTHTFQCAVIDAQMPGMSGIEVVAWIRERPRFADLPAMILTASLPTSVHDAARAAGAFRVMTKPFQPSELVDAVRRAAGK